MTVEQMIKYLRLNVSIQDPEVLPNDSAYLSMTDEDIILYMNVVITRNFADVPSLDYLPQESVYPVILLSKKELFHALAVKEAPLFDMGADNNNYLKRAQRFDHYMKLIQQVDKEYSDYLDDGGVGGNILTSFDVLISDRYATKRNYNKGVIPTLYLYLDDLAKDWVEISWKVRLDRFKEYKVYVSHEAILDLYDLEEVVKESATLVATIKDVHQTKCRITKLAPNTLYYLVVSASEMSGLTGYKQLAFNTLEDIIVESPLGG